MAIDPNVNASTEEETSSVIENELPAYRAISTGAVFALIFGVLSILCFASPYFLVFAAIAMILGVKADRTITKFPEMFTGRGLAQAGFGLGLIFGLTSVTIGTVQGIMRANSAKSFARSMENVFKEGSPDLVMWYMQNPARRDKITPEDLMKEIRNSKGGAEALESRLLMVRTVKDAIAKPGADFHFSSLERHGDADLMMYAAAVYEIHNPQAKADAEKERFALVTMKAAKTDKGRYEWWIEDIRFPYQPNTYVAPVKPVDDGHGHGGGDGHNH